ncbi:MAG: lysophospholipid acyltransferase family protein [Acidobacteriota bacterium]
MRIDPGRRLGGILIGLAGRLARWLVLALGATWRLRVVGDEHLEDLRRGGGPMLLAFWHEHAVIACSVLYRRLHRRGVPLTLLTSQSRDGELLARVVRAWGIDPVRGSSTRGGSAALRALHRAVARHGLSPILVPDGPVGPPHVAKTGVLVLAQTTGAPILPLAFAASSAWRLGSWDRMRIPKPFSRVTVVVGRPMPVPADATGDALESERLHLESLLDASTES